MPSLPQMVLHHRQEAVLSGVLRRKSKREVTPSQRKAVRAVTRLTKGRGTAPVKTSWYASGKKRTEQESRVRFNVVRVCSELLEDCDHHRKRTKTAFIWRRKPVRKTTVETQIQSGTTSCRLVEKQAVSTRPKSMYSPAQSCTTTMDLLRVIRTLFATVGSIPISPQDFLDRIIFISMFRDIQLEKK